MAQTTLAIRDEDYRLDGECWIWTGRLQNKGYGLVRNKAQMGLAHRISYQQHVGPIAVGMVLDHLCRRRDCINPAHLEPVTNAENIRRGASPSALPGRTGKCQREHEFTPENTYVRPNGKRQCRTCMRANRRKSN